MATDSSILCCVVQTLSGAQLFVIPGLQPARLPCSLLGNSMDTGAWWASVHEVIEEENAT